MAVTRKVCKCGRKYITRQKNKITKCARCFKDDNNTYKIKCDNCKMYVRFKKSLGQSLGINKKGAVICKDCNEIHIVIYNKEDDIMTVKGDY